MTTPIRVLIVEDSEDDAELLLRQLRIAGYAPQWARVDSPEALTSALAHQVWDVIVCDYMMPLFDALAALKLVQGSGHDIPFIIVSGKIGEDTAVTAMKAGACDYVMKDKLARLPAAVERELREASERKRAESALLESSALFSTAFSNSPLLMTISDPATGKFLDVNDSFCRVSGITREEAIGKTSIESGWLCAEERARMVRELERQGRIENLELVLHGKDRRTILCRYSGHVIHTASGDKLFSIAEDITERKQAENALRENNSRFQAFIEQAPMAIGVFDLAGKGIYGNTAFLKTLGLRGLHEMVGRPAFEFFGPQFQEESKERTRRRMQGLPVPAEYESVMRADGNEFQAHVAVAPIQLSDQTVSIAFLTDVSERKRAERELENYRHHLETLVAERTKEIALLNQLTFVSLESASVGAWWINFEEDDTYHALDTTANMIGVPLSRAPDKAYRISDWVTLLRETQEKNPEYGKMIERTLERFSGTISGKYDKYRVIYPVVTVGQMRWIDARADVSVRDAHGRALLMTGTLIDVTQLVEAERELTAYKTHLENLVTQRTEELALRNRELQLASERLVLATRAAHIGVWDWDVLTDVLVWDDTMYALYGTRREDFGGAYSAWAQSIHPDDKAHVEAEIQAALRGEREYDLEFKVVWPDGSIHSLQAASQTFRAPDGQALRMIGINFDTTQRRQAEDALRQSEWMLSESQRASRLGSFSFDFAVGRYESSALMDELFGIDPSYPHSLAGWQALIHPDDCAMALDYFQNEVIGRQQSFDLEYRIVRPVDQVTRWMHGQGKLELDALGRPVALRGTIQDVTERKLAEHERSKLEEQFRASQKMEAIGHLAGGVAHDFNNLLSVILGYTAFVMESVPIGDPRRDDLEEVRNAADRAVALTRQLLAFSRKQVMQPVVLDLNQVIAGVEKMLARLLGETIDFKQVLAAELGQTLADPGQLEQILMNLVVNARDAMPDGGKLTVETFNVELTARAASHAGVKAGSYIGLAVADTGCGMDAPTQAKIFEPFFTTKVMGKGTGLGLSTVFGIVKQSGGGIDVVSQPGQGSTFNIYLPRLPVAMVLEEPAPSAAMAMATKGETILVVEDEEALRNVTRRALAIAGYNVLVAANGKEALNLCEQHPGKIDLVLTDVIMPEMSGKELADRLAERNPCPGVLFMSGYTDDAIVHHGVLDAGIHFIVKPFTSASLTQKVRKVLDDAASTGS